MNNICINSIPEELKKLNQWVAWKILPKENGKTTKIPVNPNTGKYARVNDDKSWGSFEEAMRCYNDKGLHGIGFVFKKDSPYVGIDLDDCLDPATNSFSQEAMSTIKHFGSYTEISPSGKGLHIIVKGSLPAQGRKNGSIEMYADGRFFTITGNVSDEAPSEIADRRDELLLFHQQHFGVQVKQLDQGVMQDGEDNHIIQMARKAANGKKFDQLWKGDYSDYPSQSEADLALCQMLSFWTRGDSRKIDSLFRKSGLFRHKWDERRYADGETYGQATIRKALTNNNSSVGPSPQTESKQPKFNLTELGNSERLVYRHRQGIRYCHTWKSWMIWDGQRWVQDKSDRITKLAKDVVRSIYFEAGQASDTTERQEISKHARKSESSHNVNAMITLAESEVPVRTEELDQDPWLFNCQNGTLNLKTGILSPHRRENYITKLAPVNYDKKAPHPLWDAFLDRVFDGNKDLIAFMQRAIGYTLTGLADEQCLFILHGSGANGKTTFLQTISAIMSDYAMQTPTETLLVKAKGAIPNDVARLKGARFVIASEAEAEQRLAENLIKQMTGGDTISARFLHQEFFDFKPTHKMFLGTNHKPIINGTDYAIWRRIRLIPFEITIPETERDPKMLEKLLKEKEGILAWAVEGCLRWQSNGLGMPAAVKEATAGYRNEMDVLSQFISDTCKIGGDLLVPSKELYCVFEKWCSTNGEQQITHRKFTQRLKEMKFDTLQIGSDRKRGFKGLALCAG
jgi:putative DNA primase/helicase